MPKLASFFSIVPAMNTSFAPANCLRPSRHAVQAQPTDVAPLLGGLYLAKFLHAYCLHEAASAAAEGLNMNTAMTRLLLPALAVIAAAAGEAGAAPPADKVVLGPHRAVYDLKLMKTRGSRAFS